MGCYGPDATPNRYGLPSMSGPIYLAGPMSGIPEFNFPAFHTAAARLRNVGFEVVSPAEANGTDTSQPWDYYMRRDLVHLAGCKMVAVLPGWRNSKGAALEVYVATALGMPVVEADTLEPVTETVLEEAQRLIFGDRQHDYGHPLDDFTRTGRMWGAILGIPDVAPELVGLCMVAVKVSREVNHPKRDNRTDGPGYFGCVDMVHEERARRAAALSTEYVDLAGG